MRIEIVADAEALALRAADIICDVVGRKPEAVLGLPTGDTPRATYAELIRRIGAGTVDVSSVRAFAVDEFVGVASYSAGTNAAFFAEHLSVLFRTLQIPDTSIDHAGSAIAALAAKIRRRGGFDLCVLGVGANGHIAFNEPGSSRDSRAREVVLTAESRRAHAAAFGSLEAVPVRGVTLGVADILESRAIVVLAQAVAKAAIVARAVEGAPSAEVPASWLRTHDNVTWLLDEAAASALRGGTAPPAAV